MRSCPEGRCHGAVRRWPARCARRGPVEILAEARASGPELAFAHASGPSSTSLSICSFAHHELLVIVVVGDGRADLGVGAPMPWTWQRMPCASASVGDLHRAGDAALVEPLVRACRARPSRSQVAVFQWQPSEVSAASIGIVEVVAELPVAAELELAHRLQPGNPRLRGPAELERGHEVPSGRRSNIRSASGPSSRCSARQSPRHPWDRPRRGA